MNKEINGEMINIPEHVAIIMDGNGRWAKKRLMPRTYGHSEGAKAIERTCENADELGIKYLTVYAFSTENWKRSVEEVSTIMNIFRKYLVDSIERSNRNNMRVRIIGKREDLPEDIVEKMYNLEKATANNTGLQFSVAINYGGRDEISFGHRIFFHGRSHIRNFILRMCYGRTLIWTSWSMHAGITVIETVGMAG